MHIKDYMLDNMCATLEISKRTYYKYRNAQDKDYYDYLLIKEIFDENKKTYGYRRICDGLLIKYGVIFNHKSPQTIAPFWNALRSRQMQKSSFLLPSSWIVRIKSLGEKS